MAIKVVALTIFLAILPACMSQQDAVDEALAIADRVTDEVQGDNLLQHIDSSDTRKGEKPDDQVTTDAKNAHKAAKRAKQAAKVARKVAYHSIEMSEHAKSALKNANDAVNRARVETEGLSSEQKQSLRDAEAKLHEATKAAEYGQIKDAKYVKTKGENKKLKKLEKKLEETSKGDKDELEEMRKELKELRKKLRDKEDSSDEDAIKELEQQIEDMEKAEKREDKIDAKSHDEMKAEIERLRDMIDNLQDKESEKPPPQPESNEAVSVGSSLDIDTAMPYGELEPFGREDTAQELTEDSIRESDEMVDQLERAEVAEEKRAVFRALTRLRGAAITSFDGVARSQTGNIDEYNKIHQWRGTHPLHHLADEESDVSKWAFPDNAD